MALLDVPFDTFVTVMKGGDMPTPALLDPQKDHTLVLVKPDGFRRGLTGNILSRIEAKGYVLKGLKIKRASEDLLAQHYIEHVDRPFYPDMVEYMTSGPVVAVVVEGDRVVEGIRAMIGATNPAVAQPGTIRGDWGRDWGTGQIENIVHASDSDTSATREIALWFPELQYLD